MPESSLPVEHLFTMRATLGTRVSVGNGPAGTRVIVQVTGGAFEGPRMKGTFVGTGGDWVTVRPDGSMKLDVRLTLQTSDGAAIYMSYSGIGIRHGDGNALRTAPLFETGDERYAWLNTIQAVATGSSGGDYVTYDVYALKV